jgi:hypothetical protein
VFSPAFPIENPPQGVGTNALRRQGRPVPRPSRQTLISAWDLMDCHGISSVKQDSAAQPDRLFTAQ